MFVDIFIIFLIITMISILILFSTANITGCIDQSALNYDKLAIIGDNNLCLYKNQ